MKMNYLKFGTGDRVLVILPGLSIFPVTMDPKPVIDAYQLFAEDFTVYLFDRREDVDETYTIEDMADDTCQKIRELGLRDICLYGVSQGGMIAQLIVLRHPELVRKLVLASTACRMGESERIAEWLKYAEERNALQLADSFAKAVYSEDFYNRYKELISQAYSVISEEQFRRFLIYARASQGFDLSHVLSNVEIPALILGSEKDKIIDPELIRETAELLQGELYMYEDYSHAIYDEAPDIKQRIYDFLTFEIPEIGRLEDDIWPFTGISHIRYTARALIENEEGKFGFLHIVGEDLFGERDHLETCGGGLEEGELAKDALIREVREELGCQVQSYELLGVISDTYNLIQRLTCSIFFHCTTDSRKMVKTQRTQEEEILVREVLWLDPEEALERLEHDVRCDVGRLVQRRDAMALRYYLEKKKK